MERGGGVGRLSDCNAIGRELESWWGKICNLKNDEHWNYNEVQMSTRFTAFFLFSAGCWPVEWTAAEYYWLCHCESFQERSQPNATDEDGLFHGLTSSLGPQASSVPTCSVQVWPHLVIKLPGTFVNTYICSVCPMLKYAFGYGFLLNEISACIIMNVRADHYVLKACACQSSL